MLQRRGVFVQHYEGSIMNKPIWEIFKPGTNQPVSWVAHPANKRFAIFKNALPTLDDDLVLDKETGLVWPRHANVLTNAQTWLDANSTARELRLANRMGWRLPTVEELSSLLDPGTSDPALPTGHPFISVQFGDGVPAYWTSTNSENSGGAAWFVNFGGGGVGLGTKGIPGFAWPVRGGRGGVDWT
jgi:hypothetical protein